MEYLPKLWLPNYQVQSMYSIAPADRIVLRIVFHKYGIYGDLDILKIFVFKASCLQSVKWLSHGLILTVC